MVAMLWCMLLWDCERDSFRENNVFVCWYNTCILEDLFSSLFYIHLSEVSDFLVVSNGINSIINNPRQCLLLESPMWQFFEKNSLTEFYVVKQLTWNCILSAPSVLGPVLSQCGRRLSCWGLTNTFITKTHDVRNLIIIFSVLYPQVVNNYSTVVGETLTVFRMPEVRKTGQCLDGQVGKTFLEIFGRIF